MLISLLSFPGFWLVGFGIVRLLVPGASRLEKAGLAYGIGVGTAALVFFLALLAPDTAFYIILVGGLLGFALVGLLPWGDRDWRPTLARDMAQLAADVRGLNNPQRTALALIVGLGALSLVFAAYYPSTSPDEVLYDAKAWLLAQSQDVAFSIGFRDASIQRPLLTSLAQGLIYLAGGAHVKLINSGFYLAFVLLFWGALDRLVGQRGRTWILAALLASTPILWWHSFLNMTNLAAGFYVFAGVVALTSSVACRPDLEPALSHRWLFLGGLCLGFAAFTRIEYIALSTLPVGIFLLVCLCQKRARAIKWVCAGMLSSAVWWSAYLYLCGPPSGSLDVLAVNIAILFGLGLLGILDHLGVLPLARRLLSRVSRKRILPGVAAVGSIALVTALWGYHLVRFDYLFYAAVHVIFQQKHWILSIVAIALLLWHYRNHLTPQVGAIILGYYAGFLVMHALFSYMSMVRISRFDPDRFTLQYFQAFVHLYLTDPAYKITGSITRNMIAVYPTLLFLAGIMPACKPARPLE